MRRPLQQHLQLCHNARPSVALLPTTAFAARRYSTVSQGVKASNDAHEEYVYGLHLHFRD